MAHNLRVGDIHHAEAQLLLCLVLGLGVIDNNFG